MEINSEIRLDKSKVTHIVIKDSFKGIDTGWGVYQYSYCEAKYAKFLWWRFLTHDAGYWRDGEQELRRICPFYEEDEVAQDPMYVVKWGCVYSKISVSIFIGKKVTKELFFDDLESARRFCDNNFHNVNFII